MGEAVAVNFFLVEGPFMLDVYRIGSGCVGVGDWRNPGF